MKEKEKWARNYLLSQSTHYASPIKTNVALEMDVKRWIAGFNCAKEEMLKRLSMPANYGISEIMNLGDKEIENRP